MNIHQSRTRVRFNAEPTVLFWVLYSLGLIGGCEFGSIAAADKNQVAYNKSSAVAEMGDRGYNRHGPKRGGGLLCPYRGELGPRLIQCGLGRGLLPYQVMSASI